MRLLLLPLLLGASVALTAPATLAQCASPVENIDLPTFGDIVLWTPDGAPVLGTPFSLALRDAPPNKVGALYLSSAATFQVLDFGVLYLNPAALLGAPQIFVTRADGTAPLAAIPNVPASICGVPFYAQVLLRDASLPFDFQLSNGLQITAGDSSGVAFGALHALGVGESPRGIGIADFDGNGRLDLGVANTSGDSVSLLYLVSGSLLIGQTVAVGSCPSDVRFADFDGDGQLDFVTANSGSDDLSIVPGVPGGEFGLATTGPSTPGPRGLVVDDFNGDGMADAAVCNFSADTVSVFLGVGDGTLAAGQVFPVVDGPFHMEVGDMNGDSVPDLVYAARSSGDVQVALGVGDGSFAAPLTHAVGGSPRRVTLGDFNADGLLDAVAANFSDDTLSVLLGLGDGSFAESVVLAAPDNPAQLDVADANGDGHADLLAAGLSQSLIRVYPGLGTGLFGLPVDVSITGDVNSFVIDDIDTDGIPDLVLSAGPSGPGGCPTPTGVPGTLGLRLNLLGE